MYHGVGEAVEKKRGGWGGGWGCSKFGGVLDLHITLALHGQASDCIVALVHYK